MEDLNLRTCCGRALIIDMIRTGQVVGGEDVDRCLVFWWRIDIKTMDNKGVGGIGQGGPEGLGQ
jgi:hypothetical protein